MLPPLAGSTNCLDPATLFYGAFCFLCPLQLAMGASRSAAFLSLYVALAFGAACGGFNASQSNTGAIIAASVWAGGLATFVEKKSRRWEAAGAHM